MKKGLYALSFGTFGLGIAEFIMMSILPDVAAGFDISLSEAGHLISAYALGVCVGAPLVVVVARSWPLRTILLALVGLFVAGNLLMALSADYWMGLCARFVRLNPKSFIPCNFSGTRSSGFNSMVRSIPGANE